MGAQRRRTDGRRPQRRAADEGTGPAEAAARVLALQRGAGNTTTRQLLARASSARSTALPVQRNAKFDDAASKPFDKVDAPESMQIRPS